MNTKDRFIKAISFEKVDRIPMMDFGYWRETVKAWHSQGLPEWVSSDEQVEEYLGLDKGFEQCEVNGFEEDGSLKGIHFRIFPEFEEVVLEEKEDIRIYYNSQGILLKEKKNTGNMPQFLKYPVETIADFEKLLPRLEARNPARIRSNYKDIINRLKISGSAAGVWLDGFLAWPRELMGIENLSIAYYEDPGLVHAINRQHTDFIKDYLDIIFQSINLDFACFFEDMAFKNGSLISPEFFREFMTPYYEEIIDYLRKRGVSRILIDSDGNTVGLCSLFVELGADAHYPCEINSGSHPEILRSMYPKLALIGGIDKKALIQGREAIDRELSKLPALLDRGGYIPAVDHRVPPDVTLDNYKYYIQKKARCLNV